jgi:hypothetical protein
MYVQFRITVIKIIGKQRNNNNYEGSRIRGLPCQTAGLGQGFKDSSENFQKITWPLDPLNPNVS